MKILTWIILTVLLGTALVAAQFGGGSGGGNGTTTQFSITAFTNLATPPSSGVRYCSNCQATNPCTGGGGGAFAFRVGGAWDCNGTGSSAGTVTSVSVVTANGLSGTVATATTTPAITLNIAALDAAKIADGTVSSAEFQFINSVTSNVQTQLNAKQPLDAELTAIAGLTSAANKLPYFTGSGAAGLADFTPAGFSLTLSANATIGGTHSGTSSGTNTGDQTITLTGDATGSGTGSFAVTLKNTGTAGTYRSTTFDAQGRETSGTNPTTFSGYAINDTSANLAAALTDETGTLLAVFSNSPTFTGTVVLPLATVSVGNTTSAQTDLLINPTTKTSGNLFQASIAGSNRFSLSSTGLVTVGGTGASVVVVNTATTGNPVAVDAEATGSTTGTNIGVLAAAANGAAGNVALSIPVNFPVVGAPNYAIKSDSVAQSTLAGPLTATLFNGLAITNNGTNTLNIAAGKTFVVSNGLTLAGTDSTTMTFPSTSATIARTDAGNTFTGNQSISGIISSYNGVTTAGNGVPAVVATSPAGILAQTTAVGPVTVYTTPAANGLYEIFIYIIVYNTATSGSITTTLGWTDADSNTAFTLASGSVNVTPASQTQLNPGLRNIKASTAITITTAFNVVVGTPTYSVYVAVKKVG